MQNEKLIEAKQMADTAVPECNVRAADSMNEMQRIQSVQPQLAAFAQAGSSHPRDMRRVRVAVPASPQYALVKVGHDAHSAHPSTQNEEWMKPALIFAARALLAAAIASTLIFWGSAGVGVWAAYDRSVAVGRFGLITVGLLLIAIVYHSVRLPGGRGENVTKVFHAIGFDSGLLAGGFGLLFLFTHNWQRSTAQDFTLLTGVTDWIQARQPLWNEGVLLHENLVAGVLMVLLPIAGMTLWQTWHHSQHPQRYWARAGFVVGTMALLLTFSRGAWLGLAVGVALASYLYWRTRCTGPQRIAVHPRRPAPFVKNVTRWQQLQRSINAGMDRLLASNALVDWLVGSTLLVGIGYLVGITVSPLLHDLLLQPVAGTYLAATVDSRLAVWQDVLPLIQDYPFTGSGLGSTPMVLASYVYLLHVPYLNHAHSLYLQVAAEQGLPGLIGFVGMIISTGGLALLWLRFGHAHERQLAAGALAALIALLVYGVTDAELFVGLLVPLLFLPFALLIGCAPWPEAEVDTPFAVQRMPLLHDERWRWLMRGVGAAVPLIILLGLFCLPHTQSRWLLNRATVMQTQQELSHYSWPAWPIQDALRRSDQIESERWVGIYETVLQELPESVSAQRRLGQIRLSQGEYGAAEQLLSSALRLAPQQRATRQLLGELKALRGDEAGALALWQAIDVGQGQLALRQWWYDHIGEEREAAAFALLLDRVDK